MREEKRPDASAAETQSLTPEQEARRAARRANQQRRRRNSVFQYIAILFMAAFVLLLYTFMMERRQSQQQIDDLKQSASTVQTLQGLMDENAALKEENNQLQRQIDALAEKDTSASQELASVQQELGTEQKRVEALTWFWQLNDAYVRGRFNQCRELIASMEKAELADLLPEENTASEAFLSPAGRYQEIRSRVMQ